ncbi:MAG TPA: DUF1761 domain-containing protein [Vicinamibacterales bacterium]|jgi:hypothetical protein
MPAVSFVATLVATLLAFALGALWYGPLFGKQWIAAAGMTRAQIQQDVNPAQTYGATFLLTLVAAYTFGLYVGPNPGRSFAIVCGVVAGLCFVATSLATNDLFERRSIALILINGGYHVVRFTLIGVAFAFLG